MRDARTQTLHDVPVPMVYFPLDQQSADASDRADEHGHPRRDRRERVPCRRFARRSNGAEPDLLLDDVAPMSARLERDLNRERLVAWLAFSFGVLALLLASIGLYGVLVYNVARGGPRRSASAWRSAPGASSSCDPSSARADG